MSDAFRTVEEMIKEANVRGCTVVYPESNQLFVDIDTEDQFVRFIQIVAIFQETYPGIRWNERHSSSGKPHHCHIYVTLPRPVKDDRERIMMQAILGSDPTREALSLKRLERGEEHVSVFFEKVVQP